MLEFILVLSALTMIVSFIAVIRPIKSLRLPTRKRALGVLLLSLLISVIAAESIEERDTYRELAEARSQEVAEEPEEERVAVSKEETRQEVDPEPLKEVDPEPPKEVILEPPKKVAATSSGITFREVDKKFGVSSPLTDLQKEEAWKDYEGQCIEWKGTLEHLDSGLFGGIRIGMKHKSSTLTYDVSISAPEHEKDLLLTWRQGETYTYRGRLDDYGAFMGISVEWGCD